MHRLKSMLSRTTYLLVFLVCLFAIPAGTSFAASATQGPQRIPDHPGGHAKSTIFQDPQFAAYKNAHPSAFATQFRRTQPGFQPNTMAPRSARLNSGWTDAVQEPAPSGRDDAGNSYSDQNLAENCGPGASAVALAFWLDTSKIPSQDYNDHQHTNYWNGTEHHSYIMYLATAVQWPGESGWPGEVNYNSNGTSNGTFPGDLLNAINWEASGHGSKGTWNNYFYVEQTINNSTGSSLLNRSITTDIGLDGVPLIADLRAQDLPDWHTTSGTTGHYVTIVGYDNNAGTYTYIDTCGPQCGGQYGPHTISQSRLFQAINDYGQLIIW